MKLANVLFNLCNTLHRLNKRSLRSIKLERGFFFECSVLFRIGRYVRMQACRYACLLVVRFFAVIGHRNYRTLAGCPILRGYRTSGRSNACCLSDSFRLSDIGTIERLLVVRFFAFIGHRNYRTLAGCPILRGYRTSGRSNACWLSDSSRLSDKPQPHQRQTTIKRGILDQDTHSFCL